LKRAVRAAAVAAVRFSGAAWLARHTLQSDRVTVLAYHDPDPATFERHVALLASLYNVIPMGALLDAIREGDFRALPRRPLLITLDDGWAGNARLLPVLTRHGVRPTVFLVTGAVGTHRRFWWTGVSDLAERERLKGLSTEDRLSELAGSGFAPELEYPEREALSLVEIEQMAPLVDFGGHTRSHPILPACSDEEAELEISGSAEDVERIAGARARAFAYPNGDYSARDVESARRAGYECAFTVEPGSIACGDDTYRLRRVFIDDEAGPTELIARASGAYGALLRALRNTLPPSVAAKR
jgi:peptidoglycan/xylan/chitin deacetylase (PgdA/CDA1 family)